ncbi:hypothetical protein JCM9140_1610 [Halalkalibacter wakoensis JCM 9140]|uniref:DUF2339 domain-containing protein n=1 Tax=Halalkalibacter wakoensis JCM 9140 TaxID=1236970 RepID=W4Q2L3_9BACI|nr:DUF2339 domain-containing protein [Halalkalibacter wakoensis]GAE25604.1 hypothetical protein JCM9140_1610 [Halalkalibacter wakoensis JCM 9140]
MTHDKKVQQLEERIIKLENEVSRLSGLLQSVDTKTTVKEEDRGTELTKTHSKKQKPKKEVDYEKLIGQVWMPRIFIVVLLMGVLWGFKALIDVGFINEFVRVLLGYVAAVFLIWTGARQFRHKRHALGQVLMGGAIVVLILSTFAGNALYGLIPGFLAFTLNVIWVLAGMYAAHTYSSQSIAVLASIAGFFVPFLVEGTSPNVYLFVGYEIFFFLGLLFFSFIKKYITLYFVSTFLLHLTFVAFMVITGFGSELIVAGVITQHLFLLLALLLRNAFFDQQKVTLLTSFVLTHIWVVSTGHVDQTVFLIVAFIGYCVVSYIRRQTEHVHIFLPIATYSLAMLLADLFSYDHLSVFLLLQGMAAIYMGLYTRGKLQTIFGFVILFFGAAIAILTPIERVASYETISWLVLIGSLFGLRVILNSFHSVYEKSFNRQAMMTFLFGSKSVLLLIFITQLGMAATTEFSFTVQNVTVSTLWACYAIFGVVLGVVKDRKNIRLLGIVLLFLTLLKVIFVDIEAISIVVRALLFISLGTIGVAISRFFYKK